MKTTRSTTCRNALAALRTAALLAALCAALPARATLKYQPCDYVQNGLVVHLDGIANASIEELCLVKGIDPDLAQTIHDHLEAGNS